MTWPLVKPVAGYMTLSRLVSLILWPETSTSREVRVGTRGRLLLVGECFRDRVDLPRAVTSVRRPLRIQDDLIPIGIKQDDCLALSRGFEDRAIGGLRIGRDQNDIVGIGPDDGLRHD